eukprot:3562923-Heterocapsa_arctica.AAC.1
MRGSPPRKRNGGRPKKSQGRLTARTRSQKSPRSSGRSRRGSGNPAPVIFYRGRTHVNAAGQTVRAEGPVAQRPRGLWAMSSDWLGVSVIPLLSGSGISRGAGDLGRPA